MLTKNIKTKYIYIYIYIKIRILTSAELQFSKLDTRNGADRVHGVRDNGKKKKKSDKRHASQTQKKKKKIIRKENATGMQG